MHTLEELQTMGAILSSIRMVMNTETIPIGTLLSKERDKQIVENSAVVIDDPIWVGTVGAVPINQAKNVYSSDGELVGRWNRDKRNFCIMTLQGNPKDGKVSLATKQIYSFKEEQRMDATETTLQDLDLGALEEGLKDFDSQPEMKKAEGFGEDTFKEDAKMSDKERENKIKKEKYDDIRKKLDSAGTGDVTAPAEVIRNNRMFGELIAFITGTDDTIKFGTKKVPKVDANNSKILTTDAPSDVVSEFNAGKRVKASWLVSETNFVFKNAKPAAAKAVIISTPAGTDLPLTSIGQQSANQYDITDKSKKVHVIDMETAWVYLAYLYGNRIQESKDVLGERADTLNVVFTFAKSKNGEKSRPIIKPKNRKPLLVHGNYFPLKVYDTISTQDLTPENKENLNLNVEAVIARLTGDTDLSATAKAQYTAGEDGVTSAWFDRGEPIDVVSFDDGTPIRNIRLPRRIKAVNKTDPKKFNYKFAYKTLADEDGPMSIAAYKPIIEATGFSADEFQKLVSAATHKVGGKRTSKAIDRTISYEQYLRGYAAGEKLIVAESKTFADLQDVIDQMSAI